MDKWESDARKGIIIIGVVITLILLIYSQSCYVERVCQLVVNSDIKGSFDCSIIYSKLGNYWDENSSYVLGSLHNIQLTACSEEVTEEIKSLFDIEGETFSCDYYCCVTDGTCYEGQHYAINIQRMMLVIPLDTSIPPKPKGSGILEGVL